MITFDREVTRTGKQVDLTQASALGLVIKLCNALADEEIDYCHWKSNAALDRSASGDNDLDLLVSRHDAQRFTEILYRLGCKEALSPEEDELPGVRDYYGYDIESGRLIHVHAHFQLVLGSDLSKNYRLPLEKVYLESSVQGNLFRVPAPEWELVIFVIRMVLKHSTWDSILMRHGQLSPSERRELAYLSTPDLVGKAQRILQYVPGLSSRFFETCLQALQPGCSLWMRIRVGEQLQMVLRCSARYHHLSDVIVKFTRRLWRPIQRRVFGYEPKNRFAGGGLFIAIVGGDGAGKTTIIDELLSWLSGKFEVTKVHMGKPDWSWTTITIRGILKIGTLLRLYPFEGDVCEEAQPSHGRPWFIRTVCTARDRYLTYLKARRFSSNGGLVLCDRFSIPGILSMDGPRCEQEAKTTKRSWLIQWVVKIEAFYYQQIALPDLLIVLRVNPEIAVQRKTDENVSFVRMRSAMAWELDWSTTPAHVIDAGRPKEEVLSEIKSLIWSYL